MLHIGDNIQLCFTTIIYFQFVSGFDTPPVNQPVNAKTINNALQPGAKTGQRLKDPVSLAADSL